MTVRRKIALMLCPELGAVQVDKPDCAAEPSEQVSIEKILKISKLYARHVDNSLATVSLRAAGQGLYLSKLDAGEIGLTYARYDKVMLWFASNWPDDLQWPIAVPRPPKKKDAA